MQSAVVSWLSQTTDGVVRGWYHTFIFNFLTQMNENTTNSTFVAALTRATHAATATALPWLACVS